MRFHPDNKYQCPINLHTWHFQLPSLFCISITITRLGIKTIHDIYFTLLYGEGEMCLLFLLLPNLNSRSHLDHEYQCLASLHVWHFHLPSLFCICISIVRLAERNNHDIYSSTSAWHKVSPLPNPTQTSIWDSIQAINTSVWSTCMCNISIYHSSSVSV